QGHSSKPTDPKMTAQFMAYDENYKGGVAVSTGWVAGAEGGAMSIVTSQLAGDGTVRVWSNGSRLDGQPTIYLDNPNHHEENVDYAQIASFAPFPGANPGVTVATTSPVYGADLLVAGITPGGQEVRKFTLERPAPDAKTVAPKQIAALPTIAGVASAAPLAGR
ncbi:MAG: copper oxidase, partial [Ilumatobacteraceae bacterium]